MAWAGDKEGSGRTHAIIQCREMGKESNGEREKQSVTEAEINREKTKTNEKDCKLSKFKREAGD